MKMNLACLLIASNLVFGKNLRVIGGQNTQPFQYTFAVSLQDVKDFPFCMGSLLDSTTVVTAAHCSDRKPETVFVSVHRHDLTLKADKEGGAKLAVKSVHAHPQYNKEDGNDVGVWKLVAPVPRHIKVSYVSLDTEYLGSQTGLKTIVAGWGRDKRDQVSSYKALKSIILPIFDPNECAKVYGQSIIKGKKLCAGNKDQEIGTCFGDSGGPLFFKKGSKIVLVGITSSGHVKGCGVKGIPSGFTSTHKHLDYILSFQKK